jgi:hypothetical protein
VNGDGLASVQILVQDLSADTKMSIQAFCFIFTSRLYAIMKAKGQT